MTAGSEIMHICLGGERLRFSGIEKAGFGIEEMTEFPERAAPAPLILLVDCGCEPDRGLDLLDHAKTVWPHVPVIFVTRRTSEEVVLRAWKAGAWEYFRPPVNEREVEEALRFLIEVKGCASPDHLQPVPDGLQRSVEYIRKKLTCKLTLADLAAAASLSPYHFSRRFRQTFGMPPMAFVRRERVLRAARFLRETQLPVAQIAYRVGFSDYSDFARHFRSIIGTSPTRHRAGECSNSCHEKSNSRLETPEEPRTLVSPDQDEPKSRRLRRRT